ncbi:MAG: PAS domain S-box protein [Deltaproteobacteria bacterium]
MTADYELLFDANPRPMLVFDRETLAIVAVNQAACLLYGWSRHELIAMTIRELRPREQIPMLERALESERAHTEQHFTRMSRHVTKDGRPLDVDLEMSRIVLDGRACVVCLVVDLSGSETSLRRSLANFRALIERLPVGTIVHRHGHVIYINPAAVRGLRYDTASQIIGRPLLELLHPDDHDAVKARILQTMREGRAPAAEARMLRRDGTIAFVEAEAVMLDFDGQPANVVIAHEVTERRDLFARVAAADRMLSMGTLAAGVAHEINNPLSYLVSNLELLAREATPSQTPLLADAREATDRVSAIVSDLHQLTRPADDTLCPVDVVRILTSSIKMANNELRHRARLITSYEPGLPRVVASPSRLGQVFLNMLVNAAHAIGEGHADREEVRVRVSASQTRDHVFVEIEDTGVGIPAEIVGRVFDPFFTTKPHGVGVGLGLAISQQIVSSIGGEISVTSTVGVGSTFRISFRAADPNAKITEPRIEVPSVASALRILVIDDEAQVGRAVVALLSPEHDVLAVTRARAGLERLAAGDEFDVILCDLMMPELNGMELFSQLAVRDRDRLVFMTGGPFTPQARAFLAGREHLQKPFSEDQLRSTIARVVQND